jgi:hypothetical protein
MNSHDLEDFGKDGLSRRFTRGGLPAFSLADELPERDFQDWMDAYGAKDIQEVARLEERPSPPSPSFSRITQWDIVRPIMRPS